MSARTLPDPSYPGLTPLVDIPDRFAGDPQAGLKEVLKYLRSGTAANTSRPLDDEGVWLTEIRVPGTAFKACVMYQEPDHRIVAGLHDTVKACAIQKWLHDLTNVVRLYNNVPTLEVGQRDQVSTIREALQTAAAKPAPIARPKAHPVDAFVARVLARRGTGTPTS